MLQALLLIVIVESDGSGIVALVGWKFFIFQAARAGGRGTAARRGYYTWVDGGVGDAHIPAHAHSHSHTHTYTVHTHAHTHTYTFQTRAQCRALHM